MSIRKSLAYAGTLLAAVALAGVFGCEDKPTETPHPELKPTVTITGIQISGGVTRVFASGADEDGMVEKYIFEHNGAVVDTLTTPVLNLDISYASMDEQHTVSVVAVDNNGNISEPAALVFTPNLVGAANKAPETEILSPASGAVTSSGVVIEWSGRDPDGSLSGFEIRFDDGAWVELPATTTRYEKTGLALGSHVAQVRAKDNFNVVDPTPAAVTFTVAAGFAPELSTSGVSDGSTFFVPAGGTFDLTVGWHGDAEWYNGAIEKYAYELSGTATVAKTETQDASHTFAALAQGNYAATIYATDIAGVTTSKTINVIVTVPTLDREVLVVNGVKWSDYGAESAAVYPTYLAGVTAWDYWELLDTPSGGFPAGMNVNLLGTGEVPGDLIGKYKAILWLGNNYLGDMELWNPALMAGYMKAGGKVILSARRTVTFFNSELAAMAHVDGFVPDLSGSFTAMNPTAEGTALGLKAVNAAGNSLAGGFTSVEDSPFVEVLLVDGADPSYILGIRSQALEDGVWNFIVTAGRHYRFSNPEAMRDNWRTMLTDVFGVTPPALP